MNDVTQIAMVSGRTVRVGRDPEADLVVPGDTGISRLHFALAFDGRVCTIEDLRSRNGTRVNGARVTRAVVRDGDTITAGETRFVVRLPAAAETRSATGSVTIGAWYFTSLPSGWHVVETTAARIGVRSAGIALAVSDEPLPSGLSLAAYVDLQIALCRQYLADLQVEPSLAASIPGADTSIEVSLRHRADDGTSVRHQQIYATAEGLAGVATAVFRADAAARVRADLESVTRQLVFRPAAPGKHGDVTL